MQYIYICTKIFLNFLYIIIEVITGYAVQYFNVFDSQLIT